MKDVYYGEEGLFPMVRAGYAVVATDYHGLGTEGPHQYVNKIAQAYDVIFSIPAARAAVSALGERWVVDGHSQGGTAAWGVAEMEHDRQDAGYLGAVAVAPASRLDEVLTAPAAAEGFYLDYIAWGIRARTPSFKAADMLGGRRAGALRRPEHERLLLLRVRDLPRRHSAAHADAGLGADGRRQAVLCRAARSGSIRSGGRCW